MTQKTAVILCNLGGPDSLDAVRPFLFNLFSDPAMIGLPAPLRGWLAWLISTRRAAAARKRYAMMGGCSPLNAQTQAQAQALQTVLNAPGDMEARCFVAMRYWKPFPAETMRKVVDFAPDKTVLLPLYPQFSTATTASSIAAWKAVGGRADRIICCYPELPGLIAAHARAIVNEWRKIGSPLNLRILFSAHGLPEKRIKSGDPYQWQIEQCVKAVMRETSKEIPAAEHELCYQSRVGPLRWIGPSVATAIDKAVAAGKTMLVCPISFVSENIETLVELDREYRDYAASIGGILHRVPALAASEQFIDALADLVRHALSGSDATCSHDGRLCPASRQCPAQETGQCMN